VLEWPRAKYHGTRDLVGCLTEIDPRVQVELVCGVENALLAVSEPEKCEYKVTGTTPALCRPLKDGETPGGSPVVKMDRKAKEEL
jgi:protein kinase C substrate 80K-H